MLDNLAVGTSFDQAIAAILARRPPWSAAPCGQSAHGIAAYRLDGPDGRWQFLKVSPRSERHIPLSAECARLRWAADYLPAMNESRPSTNMAAGANTPNRHTRRWSRGN
ncbi:MAG TPA: hypothetical protein VNF73_05195 [Candidatus Saccharimonadales bacterium]|nr:hypothetical protein [Candidatus Saccharimonadales bacterium]